MSEVEIRVVNTRSAIVDFTDDDAYEWAIYALRHNAWRCVCEAGRTHIGQSVGTAVAIAAPNGQVAVWYGTAYLRLATNGVVRNARTSVSQCEAAYAATSNLSVAAYWDKRRTRGGDRDVTELGHAACRVLHAQAFSYKPSFRDTLLAPFAALTEKRPPTPHLLRASEDELLAANALLDIQNYVGARALLARKGVAA